MNYSGGCVGSVDSTSMSLNSTDPQVVALFLKCRPTSPKEDSVVSELKTLKPSMQLRCESMTVCAEGSLFLGSCSNLTSIFHSCAHFIDWPVGCVGSL